MSLTLSIQSLHQSLAAKQTSTEHVLLRVRAVEGSAQKAPQTKLRAVLVLDVSGSMSGEPIKQVIRSAQRLSELLSDDDSLGIVTFSTHAQVIAPLAPLTQMQRRQIHTSLASLNAAGGTNISAGLEQASQLFGERKKEERFVTLLLTDGHPTHGATTPQLLAQEVSQLRQRDISVSSLGFGASHKEEMLIEAAEAGGGKYFYISDAKLSEGNFIKALGSQRDILAEQVRLSLRPMEGVEISKVYGDPKVAFGADGLQISMPDVLSGSETNIVVKLTVGSAKQFYEHSEVNTAQHTVSPLGKSEASFSSNEVALKIVPSDPFAVRQGKCEAVLLANTAQHTVSPLGVSNRPLLTATLRAQSMATHEEMVYQATLNVMVSTESVELNQEVAAHVSLSQANDLREQARARADVRDFATAKQLLTQAKALLEGTVGFVFGEESLLTDAWETIVDDISAMEREPDVQEYQEFRKSQRDYLGFAAQGTSACGGSLLASPSARVMSERAQSGPLPDAYLLITEKGGKPVRIQITNHEMTIGRVQGNSIVLPKGNVSKQNARICFIDGGFYVFDMKSTNGTYLNGGRLNQPQLLQNGDTVYVGDFSICYEGPAPQVEPAPMSPGRAPLRPTSGEPPR